MKIYRSEKLSNLGMRDLKSVLVQCYYSAILKFYLNEVIKFAKAFSDIIIRDKTGFSL